ncbi:MAG: Endothelin-converting enzyme 1 [Acidobacteria bacterium]|nr:Endothelin-converting enzyme 1 [Acidobacteriota bacterium]
MRRQLFALTFVALPLAAALSATFDDNAQPPRAAGSAGIEIDALDRKIDPCTDFYQFACGGWIARHPVPADKRSYGRFAELQDRNFAVLRRILEAPGGEGDRKKAADFYAACMDEPAIEAAGLTPIASDLATIDEILNPDDLPVLVAHLHAYGVPALFRFAAQTDLDDATSAIASVDQDGIGLPDRDDYVKTDARSVELRVKYVAVIQKMFALAGEPPERAAADANAVLSIETALAEAMADRVTRRDPVSRQHHMTINELQALSPSFNWRKYAIASDAPPLPTINVAVPAYIRALNRLIAVNTMGDLQAYLRWHVLHEAADLLPKAFADAEFDFFSRTLAGQQQPPPRWRRCVTDTDARMGEALGQAFVEETFSPKAKADTLEMVQGIKNAMRQEIDAAPWMSGETKKAAMVKLAAVVDRIGYPDEWRDYSTLRVTRDEALGNRERALLFNHTRMLAKIGQPVDRGEWNMTPPTVNAYYSPDRNNINFPAGILQPPFYRSGRDAAVNYGAAGAVIGHELTHGFDDQGRKYDGQGNLRDWWTPADAKAYEARASCVADQYSGYTVDADTHVNGRLTLGENTADNGGLRLALLAYLAGPGARNQSKVDGFTPEQRVFLGWAQVWCESARPEAERLKAATNPHASNKYRVNGPVSNMPEFARAFSCKANTPMVRANACRVW